MEKLVLNRMMQREAWVIAILLAGCAAGAETVDNAKALDVLKLKAPVRVSDTNIWEDGGTKYAIIAGAESSLELCVDFGKNSKTGGRLFVGATHPTEKGATIVEVGSDRQKAIVTVLQAWLDEHYTAAQQSEWRTRTKFIENDAHMMAARVVDIVAYLTQPKGRQQ
jgi:hypothetical protein